MHFGTLIAALASYCQAKTKRGSWLVRMEDVDILRKVEHADTQILNTLEAYGFEWDGEVLYQSTRTEAYQAALQQLEQQHLIYPCTCSRKQLARETGAWSPVYPGTCRNNTDWSIRDYAIRIKVTEDDIAFQDRLFGEQRQRLSNDVGDIVIKRRDGLFAYQLAVVVDDAWQNITEVVRGTDLIDSTPRQIYLQQMLGYDMPAYFHFPIVTDDQGNKLSKSTGSTEIDVHNPIPSLNAALKYLGQQAIETGNLEEFWKQAIENWTISSIPKQISIPA